jgi:hypothetical protein
MFGTACKGLHCACCKTFGAGPLLILLILYVISAANKSAIVSLLIHAGEILALVGVCFGFIVGVCYAFLTWITRGHISSYEWEGYRVENSRQELPGMVVRPAVRIYRPGTLPSGAANERQRTGQFELPERRDSR